MLEVCQKNKATFTWMSQSNPRVFQFVYERNGVCMRQYFCSIALKITYFLNIQGKNFLIS